MGNARSAPARRYRVGIDVGTHSVGLACIEFNDLGRPVEILSAVSWIHDSGVLEAKTATTRLAAAGVARRVRRMRRRKVKRLRALESHLAERGWKGLPENGDPYLPWRARKRLATEPISDPVELGNHLATALRHMARHRGWRNPYVRVESLFDKAAPSAFLAGTPDTGKGASDGFRQRVERRLGVSFPDDVTVAELAVAATDHDNKVALRMGRTIHADPSKRKDREFAYIGGKLMQSDNANEIHSWARTQKLDSALVKELIRWVFTSESPRGSWVSKIGRDPLNPARPRAAKATDAFQRFRIVATLTNVRVKENGSVRPLKRDELNKAFEYLINLKVGDKPTWGDIGEAIGRSRRALAGAASLSVEGEERLPAYPPVHDTDQSMRSEKKLTAFRDFWTTNDGEHRDALITLLVDGHKDETSPVGAAAWNLLDNLGEDDLTAIDNIDLVAGRAAHSVETLRALTAYMLETGEDLHAARKHVFSVGDDWVPPTDPIGAPVGNPAVDQVTKIVARYLKAAEAEWGVPEQITIEHVRAAFMSESKVRELDRDNQRRFKAKLEQRESVGRSVQAEGRIRASDVRRFEAIQRQNSQCLYCGDTITFTTAEMDHIVPRQGVGSTNTRTNLAAVCLPCNRNKSNTPFGKWAASSPRPGVSVEEAVNRVKFWQRDNGMNNKAWARFTKEVRDRLERTAEDPEIDARSLESVAWMANELRDRIHAHYQRSNSSAGPKRVFVYRGALTAEARRVSGVEGRLPWIGGGRNKTRLDRRHHAVDAAVQTLLDESVARTLAERLSLKESQHYRPHQQQTWKQHAGSSPAAMERFTSWLAAMEQMTELLVRHFEEDRIVVTQNLRLRLGNGRVHEDTINPLVRRPVSGAFSRDEIDAAATPQLWTALTRDPDFDEQEGLPANPTREIRVKHEWFGPRDLIPFFDKPRAALAVRDGWAQLGDSIHHARIYRWQEKGQTKYGMLRVFATDLAAHAHEDLFTVDPQPSWISMRTAHTSIGRANLSEKEYVGWLVPGDELLVDMTNLLTGHVGLASQVLSLLARQRWRVSGFKDAAKISLVPVQAAGEGIATFSKANALTAEEQQALDYVFNRWVTAVGVLFSKGDPVVVRRDALGRPRLESSAHLPVCWSVR